METQQEQKPKKKLSKFERRQKRDTLKSQQVQAQIKKKNEQINAARAKREIEFEEMQAIHDGHAIRVHGKLEYIG